VEKYLNPWIKKIKARNVVPQKPENSVDLFIGESPYPPSPKVLKTIAEHSCKINRYPDYKAVAVKERLADYCNVTSEQIIVGNGSDELIDIIIKVFVGQSEEVIVPIPTYFSFWRSTLIRGGRPIFVNRTNNFDIDVNLLQKAMSPKTKVLYIPNPNNPTCNIISRKVIIDILDKMDCMVVIDECYYEYSQFTVTDLIDKYDNLIILRSLSKGFGLAGVRIGYAIGNAQIIDYLHRAVTMYPVNSLAQAAAIAALQDQDYTKANIKKIRQDREFLAREIEKLGFIVYPSQCNFLFIRTEPLGLVGETIVEALKANNIFVQDLGLRPGLDEYYFRTAIGTPDDNHILLENLKKISDRS